MIAETAPQESPHIQVRVDGTLGTIVLKREEKRNALTRQMVKALQTAFSDLHQQVGVRAVAITAAGNAFCAGTDLTELHDTTDPEDPMAAQAAWFADVNEMKLLLEMMLQFPKPIVAAVNGPALGMGLGLVLASDIVIDCEDASYGVPEPRRGLVASLVAPLLAFRIGGGHAAELLLRAKTIPAERALQLGLCHETVDAVKLWARAGEIANEISESASEAIALTKRNLYEGVGEQLSTLMSVGAASTATARTTSAASEGIAAFNEKRPPEWP
ncbi:MAG: enoyl-CoA hydratase/isomerase family protein [Planctomycetales bacterium]|nr:enoyl-CoA hydratase/isomerase family protein [Planctomycetales bacterium]